MTDHTTALAHFIAGIPFVDTHSHLAGLDAGTPLDDRGRLNLPRVLIYDYLLYMASSCSDDPTPLELDRWPVDQGEAHFRAMAPLLQHYRAQGTWAALREGIRLLHPFPEPDITATNAAAIDRAIVAAYRTHGERAWQRQMLQRLGVVRQNQMCTLEYVVDHWGELPPAERAAQQALLLPSLILDGYLFTGFARHRPARQRAMAIVGGQPTTHAAYLDFCARALDRFKAEGGASVKLLSAYCRTLRFERCDDADAAALFARDPEKLPPADLARLQGNLLYHLLKLALARRLPLIVHTGYTWPTEWGNPEHLHPLFRAPELKGLKVDLAHCGWPDYGGALIMARTYRHCYFNLCWTPLLSPTLGKRILHEAIDMLPSNKLLIGTDCATAECCAGTVLVIRRLLAEVLAEKVQQGQFDLSVARHLAIAILRDNPARFYDLDPETFPLPAPPAGCPPA